MIYQAAGLFISSALLQFKRGFKVCKKLDREIYIQRELSCKSTHDTLVIRKLFVKDYFIISAIFINSLHFNIHFYQ